MKVHPDPRPDALEGDGRVQRIVTSGGNASRPISLPFGRNDYQQGPAPRHADRRRETVLTDEFAGRMFPAFLPPATVRQSSIRCLASTGCSITGIPRK